MNGYSKTKTSVLVFLFCGGCPALDLNPLPEEGD